MRAPQLPPVVEGTAVVFAPHPDDETYALAQTIYTNTAAGTRVIGVLVTDGEASSDADWWLAEHGEDVDGDGDIDRWDFALARRAEFTAAMRALGVRDFVYLGAAATQGASGLHDGGLRADEVEAAVGDVLSGVDEPTVMTVMPVVEGDIFRGDTKPHPDHTALHDGVAAVARADRVPAYYAKVYVSMQRPWKRWAPLVVRGSDAAWEAKIAAREAYRLIGKESSLPLWLSTGEDRAEYLVPEL